MNYPKDVPDPGMFDHRSGDCPTHGDNVVFARAKGSSGPALCVECMLAVYAEQELAMEKSG